LSDNRREGDASHNIYIQPDKPEVAFLVTKIPSQTIGGKEMLVITSTYSMINQRRNF
jgi:hypothetical protein